MKLIFLHIPKAGGVTFHEILSRYYTEEERIHIQDSNNKQVISNFNNLSPDRKKKIKLLKGHMDFGLHELFGDPNARCYVTFLRDPIERIFSLYHFILRTPHHYLYNEVAGKKISFEVFAASDLTNEIDNGMVRIITATGAVKLDQMNEDHLVQAKENLTKYFLTVGIMERFDESLLLIKKDLGWKDHPFYKKFNVTEDKPNAFSDQIRSVIEKRNHLDVELYNWALKNFQERINSIPDMPAQLEELKKESKIFQVGFEEGQAKGIKKGIKQGYSKGYDYVVNKYFVLRIGKKVKNIFKK